ncbi:Putative ankyrin repeat protein MM_0045 [Geodia barretti]|uniref:Ankyrin repeat protein MM_0045 n=1 Tax=Geodia barretti TaxID=519541 RepID=A0AA35W6D1_GEOBA|nr:Putative ankyrin repeat protein MM_0045 [Geodia barretti]
MESNPTLLAVCKAVRPLTMEQTRELVFQLGVPLNVLDDVSRQYDGENRKEHFVQKLLDMKTDVSWKKIVAVLKEIDKNSLAEDIERAHISNAHQTSSPTSPIAASGPVELDGPSMPVSRLPTAADHVNPTTGSPVSTLALYQQQVQVVKESIEQLEETFYELKFEARLVLTERENKESHFLERFRDYLLDLPVAKKAFHIKFFKRNEDDIIEAKNVLKLFAILGRYCNYSNYEIIFYVVKKFCKKLMQKMGSYRDSLTSFEKATAVDVYLHAISAHPKGKISQAFIQMAMKINKAPSACSLYEIRQLKALIVENSSVESYAVYVEEPQEGSIRVVLSVPPEVGWMVGFVFMDPDFRRSILLTDATLDNTDLSTYLWGDSALMVALRWERTESIHLLLKSGAELDLQNKRGDSALMMAVGEGMTEVVSLLVKAGASLDIQNNWGDSALMVAVREDRAEAIHLLLQSGAALDLQNMWGQTALIMAAALGRNDIVSLLVKAGAALDLQDQVLHEYPFTLCC